MDKVGIEVGHRAANVRLMSLIFLPVPSNTLLDMYWRFDMKTSFAQLNGWMVAVAMIVHLCIAADRAQGQCNPLTCFGTFATVGVYDEQVSTLPNNNMNAIDFEVLTNNMTLDNFKLAMLDAYASQTGGVVNFDTIQDTHENTSFTQFDALFGSDLSFLLTVTRTDGAGGLNTNVNNGVISGANYLGIQGVANYTVQFSSPLSLLGITALSRGDTRTGTLTITYNDATTFNWGGPITMPNQDTFFAHEAPAGKSITGLSWGGGSFVRWDDLGFVLADFQPGDVDGDSDVDLVDYGIIRDNLGKTGVGYEFGDIRSNGVVDLNDFKLWRQFYPTPGAGAGVGSLSVGGAVPEPSSLLLMLLGMVAGTRLFVRR